MKRSLDQQLYSPKPKASWYPSVGGRYREEAGGFTAGGFPRRISFPGLESRLLKQNSPRPRLEVLQAPAQPVKPRLGGVSSFLRPWNCSTAVSNCETQYLVFSLSRQTRVEHIWLSESFRIGKFARLVSHFEAVWRSRRASKGPTSAARQRLTIKVSAISY